MKIKSQINTIINKALSDMGIAEYDAIVSETTKIEFGDFQFNGAMGLAKRLGQKPQEIARQIVEIISKNSIVAKAEIAGPGFVNIWLNNDFIANSLEIMRDSESLDIKKSETPQNIVVDYSGPNMAKEMHVGHLRSTIIGDTLANLFELMGDNVIRQNHIGDWGTGFGMLIAYLEDKGDESQDELKDLEHFYKLAKAKFDSDMDFANQAREYVVKIQSGDEHCLALWAKFISTSLSHCEEVYKKLGVKLTKDDVRAESAYNDDLPVVIEELRNKNLITVSDGAKCIFMPDVETPIIVQKSDGGYLYTTTDLAALRYRAKVLNSDRMCYVVDARQSEHFKQMFWASKEAGFVPNDTKLEHIAFGTMMDASGKPFKTRDGGTVKLSALLDEAVQKAKDTIKSKDGYDPDTLEHLARVIGIGAVKYADLSVSRESNYIFSWDKMLSFDGNTALYIQYAYARIQSIISRFGREISGDIIISSPIEHILGITILGFDDTLARANLDAMPHYITSYLYDLTTLFMQFYEQSPILKDDVEEKTRLSRLQLANLTARVIKQGLDILGIEVVNKI